MNEQLLARIERAAGIPDLVDVLADRIAPTDVQSLLLEVYRRRAAGRSPAEVARRYGDDRFVRRASIDPLRMRRIDDLAFGLARDYEPVELSPLAPFGACSVLGPMSQDVAVSTARNSEVCSDPTNVMALECAARRRRLLQERPGSAERVRRCTSHRVVRTRRVEGPQSWSHFRLFALCCAGRREVGWRFECESLREQVAFHIQLLEATRGAGADFGQVLFGLTCLDESFRAAMVEDVLEPLRQRFPDAAGALDDERSSGRGYYDTACFQVNARMASGEVALLADGGFTGWTRKLLGDQRERLMISGFGTERWSHELPSV